MKKILCLTLALILSLGMMGTVLAAEDPVVNLTGAAFPAAVGGVIKLEPNGVYGNYTGTITIAEAVKIVGNGATVQSNISITTDQPVIIENIKMQPQQITGTGTYSNKSGISIIGVKTTDINHVFNVTIKNVVFGNPDDSIPSYRSIALPEPVAKVGRTHKGSALHVEGCTFNDSMYNINLLEADNINIINNTFTTKTRASLQYSVTNTTQSINITGNAFNGTGNLIVATINGDSSMTSLGNLVGNTISATGNVVVSVHNKAIEQLTLQPNVGLTASNLHFSSYSANPNFKPTKTGPLSGDQLARVTFGSGTDVKATVDPTFTIIIPSSVNFGRLVKGTEVKELPFVVKAENFFIETGAEVNVSLTGILAMSDGRTPSTSLPYQLYNAAGDALASGNLYNSFKINGSDAGKVTVDTALITVPGSYNGTMTFNIAYIN